jgi:hypothetical protein
METGERAVIITLSNREGWPSCRLDGYPRVSFATAKGMAFGIRQLARSQYFKYAFPTTVILHPGQAGYFKVVKYRCDLGTRQVATRLRFTLPGIGVKEFSVPLARSTGLALCRGGQADPGNAIGVTPVEANTQALSPG